jgi:REP-associated tyrosine transposase
MPRCPRLDYPGALHHVICRGIERRKIFYDDRDRRRFLEGLGRLVVETKAGLYAWALMPNHAHVLVRTGTLRLSHLVQRWLGSYATTFNLIHRRAGHLFQGRFKSVLVEEETHLLELVRYIHLNPVRSRLAVTVDSLDTYAWTGHAVLLGNTSFPAQDTAFVLGQFAPKLRQARFTYREFVREGLRNGCRTDLDGGGLRRSAGGWALVPNLKRGRESWEFDERILGSSGFVQQVLARLEEPAPPCSAQNPVDLLDSLCERVARHVGISTNELRSSTLRVSALDARAMVSHVAVCCFGLSLTAVGRHLNVARPSIARALRRAGSAFDRHDCSAAAFLDG